MSQYAMYLRKSRADEEAEKRGDEETLARHEKILTELANTKNLNITNIYREVVSGETIAARPMIQKLLNEVEQGLYEGVLVVEVERLARGATIDQGIMAQAFQLSNTKIITPLKIYDPNNEYDEEYFEFGLFMSRREYKTINRRIQRGRLASVREGKFVSSTAPYGYLRMKLENDKGYTLKPHPEQADVVKMIYEWYTKGELQNEGTFKKLGMPFICKKLDSLHITPVKSIKWSRATIREILLNPVYIGKIRWQWRKEIKKVVNGQIVKVRPKQDEYILVDGLHEPIIDEDTFNLARECITHNKKHPIKANNSLQNPLSGIVKCGKCGAFMTRLAPNSRNKYSTLKCPNRYCDNVSAPIEVIENKILDSLKDWLSNYCLNYILDCRKTNQSIIRIKEATLAKLNEELDRLRFQLDNIYDLLEQGVYTNEIFLERNKIITSKIYELDKDIILLNKKLSTDKEVESTTKLIPDVVNIIESYYTLPSAQAKNDFLKLLLEKVLYVKTEKNTRGKLNRANFDIIVFPKIPKN